MVLSATDARALIRLLAEAAMIRGVFSEIKSFIMNGLCNIIQADCWVLALGCEVDPPKLQVFVDFMHGGFTEKRFTDYLAAVEHSEMVPIASKFAESLAQKKTYVTMQRDEMDLSGSSYRGDVGALLEKANIGDLMLSGTSVGSASVSTIGVYRSLGAPLFNEREKHLVNLVLSEVPWLLLSGWPEDRGAKVPRLYPRQRVVLNLLLEGMSRKQIAGHLEISENTIAGYAKDIFRHFDVHSHVELMKKFLNPSRPPNLGTGRKSSY